MKRIISIVVLTASLAGIGAAATAAPASASGAKPASAYGCSFWNTKVVGGVPVPGGQYCVTLAGQGTFVSYVAGGFASVGNVCNWNITAEFFDSSGHWYQTYSGPRHNSCTHSSSDAIGIYA
jgi:hypothetical protein